MLPGTIDPQAIAGWNIDADPRNDPTYPMRDIAGDSSHGLDWQQPTPQASEVEVLQSVEYIRRPAVFGTTSPPSGLSGVLRRLAFKKSESDWWHWLILIAADRVNVIEGMIDDLKGGKIPNIPAEMGMAAEMRFNRPAVIRKTATILAVSAVALAIFAKPAARPRLK